jgi:hypothetical protein
MSDIKVVALSLTAEFMSIDSENSLFKQLLPCGISNLIERCHLIKEGESCFYFQNKLEQN